MAKDWRPQMTWIHTTKYYTAVEKHKPDPWYLVKWKKKEDADCCKFYATIVC